MNNIISELKLLFIVNKIIGISIFSYDEKFKTIRKNSFLMFYTYLKSILLFAVTLHYSYTIICIDYGTLLLEPTNIGILSAILVTGSIIILWTVTYLIILCKHNEQINILQLQINEKYFMGNNFKNVFFTYRKMLYIQIQIVLLFIFYFILQMPVFIYFAESNTNIYAAILYLSQLFTSSIYLLFIYCILKMLHLKFKWYNEKLLNYYNMKNLKIILKIHNRFNKILKLINTYFQFIFLINVVVLIIVLTTHCFLPLQRGIVNENFISIFSTIWIHPIAIYTFKISNTCGCVTKEVNSYV